MKQLPWIVIGAAAALTMSPAQPSKSPFLGRWDIQVTAAQTSYPDWMEVTEKNGAFAAYVQPRSGGARRVHDVKVDGSHLTLTFQPGVIWDLTAEGDKLTGAQKRGEEVMGQLAG